MSTCAEFLTDLRDRLDDAGDALFSEATKIRFLNRGQAAMFPRQYKTARDSTITLVSNTFEYNIPSAVGSGGKIVSIEVEDSGTPQRLYTLENYDIIPGLTDPILRLRGLSLPGAVGANIRITAAMPLTAFTASGTTYTGSAVSEELPVLYAMSLCMAALVEKRMNYRRLQTIEGMNGAGPEDFMTASQFWMQQFQTLSEQLAMPLPAGV